MPSIAKRTGGPAVHGLPETAPAEGSRDVTWDVLSNHINDLITVSDLSGTIFYASPSCRLFGYEPHELVGLKAADLIHPEDLSYAVADLASMSDAERAVHSRRERRFRRKDGSWVWLEGNPSVLESSPGVVAARLNIFRNVTERRADREAIEEQSRRASMAEEVAGVGYWRLDAQSLEATWSPQMFRMYGLAAGDTIGLTRAMDMVHPDDKVEADARVEASLRTGQGWDEALTRIVQSDGSIHFLAGRGVCETDASGQVTAVFGTAMDVTAQILASRALEDSERRYRLITESATDMISLTSCATGRLSYLSPSLERVTGYSVDEMVGARMQDQVHPEDREAFMAAFGALLAGTREPGQAIRFRARHKDGTWLWLESNPRLVRASDGTPTDIIDVTRDVTQQEALKAQLSDALAAAEQAAAVKGEFLANMSHEIRTPLTAVLGFSALLLERRDLDAVAQNQVGRIAAASRALLAVVNDVLDFSKLEAGEAIIRRRPASPERAAREVLEMFAPQAEAKGLDLRFDAAVGLPKSLLIDDDRLRQILINLVGNAVKFTASGRVSLSLSYDADAGLIAEVTDSGVGIAPEALAKLFQRFSQVDASSTRSKGGTGLGLAICRGLADAMGGSVSVISALGQGSTFRLTLPALRGADAGAVGASEADLALLCGLRVLIADDNTVNRELARAILEPAGVEVSEASDGGEAVEMARQMPFDAILMDLRMPVLDGQAAMATLRRESGPNQHMPVLAFSADGAMDAAAAAACGFQGVVCKPTSPEALLRALLRIADPGLQVEEGIPHVAAG